MTCELRATFTRVRNTLTLVISFYEITGRRQNFIAGHEQETIANRNYLEDVT